VRRRTAKGARHSPRSARISFPPSTEDAGRGELTGSYRLLANTAPLNKFQTLSSPQMAKGHLALGRDCACPSPRGPPVAGGPPVLGGLLPLDLVQIRESGSLRRRCPARQPQSIEHSIRCRRWRTRPAGCAPHLSASLRTKKAVRPHRPTQHLEHIPARLNRILKALQISDSWLPY
jgi:hypothetical protein